MLGYHQRCGTQARSDVGRDRVGGAAGGGGAVYDAGGVNVAWLLLFDKA
jgi:hypothetical protein